MIELEYDRRNPDRIGDKSECCQKGFDNLDHPNSVGEPLDLDSIDGALLKACIVDPSPLEETSVATYNIPEFKCETT